MLAEGVKLMRFIGRVVRFLAGLTAPRRCVRLTDIPFFEWTEMKVSHSADGTCTADVMSGPSAPNPSSSA